MSIWEYRQSRGVPSIQELELGICAFCNTELVTLRPHPRYYVAQRDDRERMALKVCSTCGWWIVRKELVSIDVVGPGMRSIISGGIAVLRELDLLSSELHLEDLRTFLVGRYEKRLSVHPRLFEEAVASVYRDIGYEVLVTSYSKDGGVDVILYGSDGLTVGVQVKRTQNKIKAEQIRSLTGALVLGGFTEGIFVTTSSFQPGARITAALSGVRGYPVELLDAKRFLGLLQIAQRPQFRSFEDWISRFGNNNFPIVMQDRLLADNSIAKELVEQSSRGLLTAFWDFALKGGGITRR